MGSIFKKTYTKPLPQGAEMFTRKGRDMARWNDAKGKSRITPVTKAKNGELRLVKESETYVAKFRDGSGVIREVATNCRDLQTARAVLADLERRAELVKAGVITPSEDCVSDHQSIPIE